MPNWFNLVNYEFIHSLSNEQILYLFKLRVDFLEEVEDYFINGSSNYSSSYEFKTFQSNYFQLIENIKKGIIFTSKELRDAQNYFDEYLQSPAVTGCSLTGIEHALDVRSLVGKSNYEDYEKFQPFLRVNLELPKSRIKAEFLEWLDDIYIDRDIKPHQDPLGNSRIVQSIKDNRIFPLMDLLFTKVVSEQDKTLVGNILFSDKDTRREPKDYAWYAFQFLRLSASKEWF